MKSNSFIAETAVYASRVKLFNKIDWVNYVLWVGLMLGLFFSTTAFILFGVSHGVSFPEYVYNVPVGTFIFVVAIAFDTIGHRTVYKEELKKGEELVHEITIFAGITSCILLCLAYRWPVFLKFPALTMVILSIFYSVIDEAHHWRRYWSKQSDRVETWSHFFIFVGHLIFIIAWYHWFNEGYPGVSETLNAMGK